MFSPEDDEVRIILQNADIYLHVHTSQKNNMEINIITNII